MSLRQVIGLSGTGRRLLPHDSWTGDDHCQNSQTGTFRQPCVLPGLGVRPGLPESPVSPAKTSLLALEPPREAGSQPLSDLADAALITSFANFQATLSSELLDLLLLSPQFALLNADELPGFRGLRQPVCVGNASRSGVDPMPSLLEIKTGIRLPSRGQ